MGFAGRQKQLRCVIGVPGQSERCRVSCEKQERGWSQFAGGKGRSQICRYLVYTYSRYGGEFTLEQNQLNFFTGEVKNPVQKPPLRV